MPLGTFRSGNLHPVSAIQQHVSDGDVLDAFSIMRKSALPSERRMARAALLVTAFSLALRRLRRKHARIPCSCAVAFPVLFLLIKMAASDHHLPECFNRKA